MNGQACREEQHVQAHELGERGVRSIWMLHKQSVPMQVLGVVHAVHAIAVFFKLMAPSLYHPSYRAHEMWSIVALNSFNLAMACRYTASIDHEKINFKNIWLLLVCFIHFCMKIHDPLFCRWTSCQKSRVGNNP